MEILVDYLHIPRPYVRQTLLKDLFIGAFSHKWLNDITSQSKVPENFYHHEVYTAEEIQASLWDSELLLGSDWLFVYIYVIPKPDGQVLMPSLHSDTGLDSKDLSYSQFLHYVSQTNYKNLWKEAHKKFPEAYRLSPAKPRNQKLGDAVAVLRALLSRIYNSPIIDLQDNTSPSQCGLQSIDNIIKSKIIIETPSHFLVFLEYIPVCIHQCLSLSPGLLNQNGVIKLFLTHQLLRAVKEMQERSLFIEGILWHHIFITDTLRLKALPAVLPSLMPVKAVAQSQRKEPNLQQLTTLWVKGCISNYDYLMALNDLAGRQMDNPFHHPVLPWISDLSSPFGNWRDLTKSKFRLNKGDRQLDLTFDPTTFETPEGKEDAHGLMGTQQVPHHVTDVLSEITFYVYKARRIARSVLCRYVRSHWNPLEYPSSIERMQQWTPDECIPQFFSDPSIFKSIHKDLPDLGHPSWASSPEDFIVKHRNALESPYVSERLHHWIDLTFGFRLSGTAAIKSKNVHLSLVDQHTHLSRRGVVQLFTQPHPRRLLPSPFAGRSPPRLPPVGRCLAEENLPIPLDYNPAGLLQQLETVNHFCDQAENASNVNSSTGSTQQLAVRRQRDLQWLATLTLELFLPQKFRSLRMESTLEERVQICRHIFKFEMSEVPRTLRAFLKAVFDNDVITPQGLPPPSAHQLLQPMVSLIPFPTEFPAVESAANHLNQLLEQTHSDFAGAGKILANLTGTSSIYLLIPLVKALFQKSSTAFQTALHLFDPMAAAIGPQESTKEFVPLLLKLMSPEEPSAYLVFLYHRRFLLMLQIRLGLRCFLNNFSLLLVEAVGGCYDVTPSTGTACPLDIVDSGSTASLEALKIKDTSTDVEAEVASETEAGVFSFEVGEDTGLDPSSATAEETVPETPSRNSSKLSLAAAAFTVRDIHQLNECSVSQVSADSLLWLSTDRLGPVVTARYLTRNLLRMLALCYIDETSLNRLEADQISKDVSTMFQISGTLVQGDFNAGRLLTCLTSIAALYGEQFILLQYLPHATELTARCCSSSGNISLLLEGGLIGCCSLILAIIPFLQDSSFMTCLRETLIQQLLQPMVDAVVSTKQLFARGGTARSALATKLLECICAVSIRLGTDAAAQVVSDLAVKLLKSFDQVSHLTQSKSHPPFSRGNSEGSRPDWMTHQRRLSSTLRQAQANTAEQAVSLSSSPPATEAQALTEMAHTFTDQFAFQLLSSLNLVLGVGQVQQLVEQSGKAVQRCAAQWASHKNETGDQTHQREERRSSVFGMRTSRSFSSDTNDGTVGSYGSRVSVIGNRIQLFEEEEELAPADSHDNRPTVEEAQDLLCYRKTESSRHLRGNWLAYWEHEAGRHDRDTRFNFKQIRLLQMTGHTAGIRMIHVMDNEFGVITAGRDRTARVWSLHSQGDGSSSLPARFVYTHHRKPLLGVSFIEASRLAASCDGAVHLWDPFVGTSVRQLDATSSSRYPTVTAMKALPSPSASLVIATAEGTLRLLDTRSPLAYQQELKISPVAAGLVRCLATGPTGHWVAAGHSSGILSLVDLRTGMLISSWKGHEGEVLQVSAWASPAGAQHLISSSLDQSLSVWSADDGKFKFNFRGSSEPVHCLSITGGELVTATTANRIGVYTSLTPSASFSSTKLRSDTFKGVLTSLALAPLNRMMLLGSDSGMVSLFC